MKRRRRLGAAIIILIVVAFLLAVLPYYTFFTKEVRISPLKTILGIRGNLLTVDNTINILILGIPGGSHDGPTLSDTIVVAHVNLTNKTVQTLGIPRDIWSATLKDRINSAYAYGEAQEKGGGMKLARAEVADIIGQPIQYAMVINFSQFRQLIDSIGGITVDVEQSFVDNKFPIAGHEIDECNGDPALRCRYETVRFTKGVTKMNGETALKFVRSRQAEGNEGTDFARNKRQELVLNAVKKRTLEILSVPTIATVRRTYSAFDTLVERNISNQQSVDIIRAVILKKDIAVSATIPQQLLVVPPAYQYDGKYVLIPKEGNNTSIHQFVDKSFGSSAY